MRIIGGQLKGRQFKGKLPSGIRPTTDFARESLFNILANYIDFETSNMLDLFAGSGAISIEALSRGFNHVTIVDKSLNSIQYIKSHIELFSIDNNQYKLIKADSLKFIQSDKFENSFDFIFCDPPYHFKNNNNIIELLLKSKAINDNTILVIESAATELIHVPESIETLKIKTSGQSKHTYLKLKQSI